MEDDDDNFLNRFRHTSLDDEVVGGSSSSSAGPRRFNPEPRIQGGPAKMALPGSWERPKCEECGQLEGPEGGGRYGTDDHVGLFFCGKCWQAWDEQEKANIMRPVYQQKPKHVLVEQKESAETDGNFFHSYAGQEGTDDIDGAWDPFNTKDGREGEMALPGSWERPLCVQCGNDEGEEGGGRYGHGPDEKKFFCGKCWKSWDEAERKKMMMAYAPQVRFDLDRFDNDPMVDCPPPEPPPLDDDFGFGSDDGGMGFSDDEVLEYDDQELPPAQTSQDVFEVVDDVDEQGVASHA
eukprot:CAMPEP_0197698012 /NCGR_PEP_ID=MMETSP1338-20131121/118760_1 /TAXON_ID=43686 ORGANISM="Pelagodinium beii, Strain RCC1491" /NCGR_SAMPLE_ID=MMETSP1338 /ASSEMBLY_ACC=CAM_ASM_000754 /LENGTH=292 /DNA_ID=CAMNT_0043281333 /DNA_START=33 /DNA_END=908 /DNA_ORIENTATION=-